LTVYCGCAADVCCDRWTVVWLRAPLASFGPTLLRSVPNQRRCRSGSHNSARKKRRGKRCSLWADWCTFGCMLSVCVCLKCCFQLCSPGLTWSKPRNITSSLWSDKWHLGTPSNGHGIQTATGRLIIPVYVRLGSDSEMCKHLVIVTAAPPTSLHAVLAPFSSSVHHLRSTVSRSQRGASFSFGGDFSGVRAGSPDTRGRGGRKNDSSDSRGCREDRQDMLTGGATPCTWY